MVGRVVDDSQRHSSPVTYYLDVDEVAGVNATLTWNCASTPTTFSTIILRLLCLSLFSSLLSLLLRHSLL